VNIERVDIDPEEALKLLESNERNRPMDWSLVGRYARHMKEGRWRFVGDPIRVSSLGRLLDGQNRLQAIIMSETTQEFVLITGLPEEDQAYMDIGKKRTPGEVFHMNDIPRGTIAAGITNLVIRYEMGNILDRNRNYVLTPAELLDYYKTGDNGHLIDEAVRSAMHVKTMVPLAPAVSGCLHVLASRITDVYDVNQFFESLTNGFNLEEGNPIATLRNTVIKRKREDLRTNRYEYLWLLVRTWNAWATREELFRIQLPKGGLQQSKQFVPLIVPNRGEPSPVTEDNPVSTPYSLTPEEARRKGLTN
jgi:hypothetical protein